MKGLLYPGPRSARRETVSLFGKVTLGASGAISSQTAQAKSGFVVTHIGTGKYRVTLTDRYAELIDLAVTVQGANSTYAAAKGSTYFIVTDNSTASTKYVEFQMVTGGGTNAVPEDSAKLLLTLVLAEAP